MLKALGKQWSTRSGSSRNAMAALGYGEPKPTPELARETAS